MLLIRHGEVYHNPLPPVTHKLFQNGKLRLPNMVVYDFVNKGTVHPELSTEFSKGVLFCCVQLAYFAYLFPSVLCRSVIVFSAFPLPHIAQVV